MKNGKSAGATGMTVEHVKEWMAGTEDEVCPTHIEEWKMVMDLVKCCFTNNAKEALRAFGVGMLALTPKDITSCSGIVLLETICKLALTIVTFRLSEGVEFHNAVHGFQAKRGTGTVIIEFKLLTHCTKNCGAENLCVMFLDLQKACCTLDRTWTLEILEGHGVGPNIQAFMKKTWDGDRLASKQAGFHGELFDVGGGVQCGDIDSPVIFNVVVDAVI
jgi:hypothetical protein